MNSKSNINIIFVFFILLNLFAGCAAKQNVETAWTDEAALDPVELPGYLYGNGEKKLAAGDVEGARRLFAKAISVDRNHVPSLLGMAHLEKIQGHREKATGWIQKAYLRAESKENKLAAKTALMEVHLHFKQGDWVEAMETAWNDARKISERPEKATLLMGKAYLEKKNFLKASVQLRQVIDWQGSQAGEADHLLEKLYAQLRAEPGTEAGRHIAGLDKISRADFAALIVEELRLPEFLLARERKKYNTGFVTPQEYAQKEGQKTKIIDITGHSYEMDIKSVLKFDIRGLEVFPDGRFHPGQPMSRANFALAVEDIISRIKNESQLKKVFIGNVSPFPDVFTGHYAFNAMVVCTTRNFLSTDLDGAFRPNEFVSGTETLLAIRRLKEELKAQQINF